MVKKILFVLLLLAAVGAASAWFVIFRENTVGDEKRLLKIPAGSEWTDVMSIIENESLLANPKSFQWLAEWSGYHEKIKPGAYGIFPGMNNLEILRLLVSGKQQEIRLVLHSRWGKEELVDYVSGQIAADRNELMGLLNDSMKLKESGWNPQTVLALFVPNTYNFYWTTTASGFMERMRKEHAKFWNEERVSKADKLGLSIEEVSVLASIVEKETTRTDEMHTIAGVYRNRLRVGMKLQADPTWVYAVGDTDITRVKGNLEYPSPYNTYYVFGLPPGLICTPSIKAIDAVLMGTKHNYLYFCAKSDGSGYHDFAVTFDQHLANARKYWNKQNDNGNR